MSDAHNQVGAIQVGRTSLNQWPNPYPGQYYPRVAESRDGYANRIVVERREHDATIKFFRDGRSSGSAVATITVPLAVLDALAKPEEG